MPNHRSLPHFSVSLLLCLFLVLVKRSDFALLKGTARGYTINPNNFLSELTYIKLHTVNFIHFTFKDFCQSHFCSKLQSQSEHEVFILCKADLSFCIAVSLPISSKATCFIFV